jgi:hypothetical protein
MDIGLRSRRSAADAWIWFTKPHFPKRNGRPVVYLRKHCARSWAVKPCTDTIIPVGWTRNACSPTRRKTFSLSAVNFTSGHRDGGRVRQAHLIGPACKSPHDRWPRTGKGFRMRLIGESVALDFSLSICSSNHGVLSAKGNAFVHLDVTGVLFRHVRTRARLRISFLRV